jgi:hypothetical protein
VSTGSAVGGAAATAGLVTGTAPTFTLLGRPVRRATTGRPAAFAGIVALVTGLPTALRFPARPPGRLRHACSMGMYAGFVNFF